MGELHFTYVEPNRDELLQGDILRKSPELEAMLRDVHPHYANNEYTHYQVITQSCDLVLRNGKCKTRYITIAAVRTLETVINRELEKKAESNFAITLDGIVYCSDAAKDDLKDFLKKIYNNQSKDYFFLNAAESHGIETDSCTFLPLTIAIKADRHFKTCLDSKILQLEDNFQSRLGWMVGNLYSRVGTKDYVPDGAATNEAFNKLVSDKLLNHLSWVKQTDFSTYKKNPELSVEEIKKKIEEDKGEKIKLGVDEIIRILKLEIEIDADKEKAISNRLSASGLLQSRFVKS